MSISAIGATCSGAISTFIGARKCTWALFRHLLPLEPNSWQNLPNSARALLPQHCRSWLVRAWAQAAYVGRQRPGGLCIMYVNINICMHACMHGWMHGCMHTCMCVPPCIHARILYIFVSPSCSFDVPPLLGKSSETNDLTCKLLFPCMATLSKKGRQMRPLASKNQTTTAPPHGPLSPKPYMKSNCECSACSPVRIQYGHSPSQLRWNLEAL